jgi:hypothetical protein
LEIRENLRHLRHPRAKYAPRRVTLRVKAVLGAAKFL